MTVPEAKVVRIEMEYADGTVETLVGEAAEKWLKHSRLAWGLAQSHNMGMDEVLPWLTTTVTARVPEETESGVSCAVAYEHPDDNDGGPMRRVGPRSEDLDRLPAYLDTDDVPAVLAWLRCEIETFGLGDRPQSPPVWMLRLELSLRAERMRRRIREAGGGGQRELSERTVAPEIQHAVERGLEHGLRPAEFQAFWRLISDRENRGSNDRTPNETRAAPGYDTPGNRPWRIMPPSGEGEDGG